MVTGSSLVSGKEFLRRSLAIVAKMKQQNDLPEQTKVKRLKIQDHLIV